MAVLWDPQGQGAPLTWEELELPAKTLRIQLHSLEVRSPRDFEKAFADATQGRAEALFLFSSPATFSNLNKIAGLAVKHRLPSIFQWPNFADAGGLMSYGPDRADMFRRAATYVDKILKGAKPAVLPVEQPTRFELVVNMKTAKALGITIPQTILVRTDRVIE